MKQTNLEMIYGAPAVAECPCLAEPAFVWGGYSFAMFWLWEIAAPAGSTARAAVWAVALLAGLALALGAWEGNR